MLNISEIFLSKRNLIFLMMVCCAIFAGYVLLVRPQLQAWLEQEQKNNQLKIQITQQQKQYQELQKLIIKNNSTQNQTKKIFNQLSENALLKQLMQIGEKKSLQINILMPLEVQDKSYFKKEIIHMVANGSFPQIKAWLQDMMLSEPAVSILKFSLQNNASTNELMLDVLLAVYSEK